MYTELQRSIDLGAAFYEPGLDGKGGGFTAAHLLVGYREGKPCPECGTAIEKIKTGTTSDVHLPALSAVGIGAVSRGTRQ